MFSACLTSNPIARVPADHAGCDERIMPAPNIIRRLAPQDRAESYFRAGFRPIKLLVECPMCTKTIRYPNHKTQVKPLSELLGQLRDSARFPRLTASLPLDRVEQTRTQDLSFPRSAWECRPEKDNGPTGLVRPSQHLALHDPHNTAVASSIG
jgi:hypothetical protein